MCHQQPTTLVDWHAPIGVSVVDGGGETPGPIPNPEAKPARADGTALGRVWESRLPPTQQLQTQHPAHHKGARGAFWHPPRCVAVGRHPRGGMNLSRARITTVFRLVGGNPKQHHSTTPPPNPYPACRADTATHPQHTPSTMRKRSLRGPRLGGMSTPEQQDSNRASSI